MSDMFLKLPNVTGESLAWGHVDEIEIHEWTWSLNNHAPYLLNQADATKQTHVDRITIHKMFDNASITLINYCASGTHIPKGTINCRKDAADKQGSIKLDYLRIELEDVKVEEVKWMGRGGEVHGIPEQVELSFLKFKIAYSIQDETGVLGAWNEFHFDIPQHKGQPPKTGRAERTLTESNR